MEPQALGLCSRQHQRRKERGQASVSAWELRFTAPSGEAYNCERKDLRMHSSMDGVMEGI